MCGTRDSIFNGSGQSRDSHVDRWDQCVGSHFQSRGWMVCQTFGEGCPCCNSCASFNTSGQNYGVIHSIHQGEGAKQRDALVPMLFSSGQHGARKSIQDSLQDDKHLFAHLDDLHVVCSPKRVAPIFKIIAQTLVSERTRTPECGEAKDLQRNRGSESSASQSVTRNFWRLSFGRPQRSTVCCTNGFCTSRISRVRGSCSSSARTTEP